MADDGLCRRGTEWEGTKIIMNKSFFYSMEGLSFRHFFARGNKLELKFNYSRNKMSL